MRRSALLCVVAGVTVLAAGCSSDDQKPGPMEPSAEMAPGGDQSDLRLRCRNHGLIVVQLLGILSPKPPARLFQHAVQKFAMVEVALLTRRKELAQARALDLIDFLADNRDNLIKANTPATLTKLVNVVDAILCVVGLEPTGAELGPNTGIGVVPADNEEPVLITTPQGDAGLLVPIGVAPDTNVNGDPIPGVVVTVTGLGNTTPLDTPLDQYGQTVDLTASQEVVWRAGGVAVAICVALDEELFEILFERLRLGHEGGLPEEPKFGAIEILPQADDDDVDTIVGSCSSGLGNRSAFGGLREFAKRVLLPKPLYAAALADRTGGVGGTTKKFSKFRAVDPELELVALPASTDGTAGAPVAQPPSVRIRTKTELTPIPGIVVGFVVDGETGEISPSAVTTNSSGVAATNSWILGLGENTVIATPVEPVVEINFTPPSVTFTAEGTENPIEYRSSGYRFLKIGSTPPSGSTGNYPAGEWFLPEVPPTEAWGTGGAPFGQPGAGCSIYDTSPVVTTWEASATEATQANPNTGTGLLVRRGFTTPIGFEGEVLINVAVDNDIQVYLDGTDITNDEAVDFEARTNTDAVNGFWDEFISPFQPHGGCAKQNDGTFTVPNSLLGAGTTHVVAVYAHDWGGASYLDIQVELD